MKGHILFGVNNIYTASVSGKQMLCRIKGKILQDDSDYYNPIAVGDYVEITQDALSDTNGTITSRYERKNTLIRYNNKKNVPQVIAANVDTIVCVTSVKSPPFRPRFLDRLIVSALFENIEFLICVNKCDLGIDPDTQERITQYRTIGYNVMLVSAETGEGIEELNHALQGRIAVFAGQSGVGKSTLLNKIEPTLALKVGEISKKYDRGVHTTRFSILIPINNNTSLIDTPGIRELSLWGIEPEELKHYFTEFIEPAKKCSYSSCLHINEPECSVKSLVEQGLIHPDRYESYLRLYESLKGRKESW
jgi:ribosome biogenesis GTPase